MWRVTMIVRLKKNLRRGNCMFRLKSVGVMSVAKIMGAMYALLGLIFLPILLIAAAAGMMSGGGDKTAGMIAGVGMVAFAIMMPLIYGAMGFIGGAISALIYNLMAGRLGGVEMNLQPADAGIIPVAGV
jgi:hypothetical protein